MEVSTRLVLARLLKIHTRFKHLIIPLGKTIKSVTAAGALWIHWTIAENASIQCDGKLSAGTRYIHVFLWGNCTPWRWRCQDTAFQAELQEFHFVDCQCISWSVRAIWIRLLVRCELSKTEWWKGLELETADSGKCNHHCPQVRSTYGSIFNKCLHLCNH